MKLRKILSSVVAGSVAVSAMAIGASALSAENYLKDGTVFVNADKETDPNWTADSGIAITDVYGVTYHLSFDEAEVADESAWIGGGVGANSPSTGWKQIEWGRAEKEIIVDLSVGDVTWLSDEPIFAADDAYAQFWIQTWGGTVTVEGAEILGKDGVVLSTGDEAGEASAEAKWNAETVMVYQESETWTATKSEPVTITADGEYTYSITGLNVDPSKTTVLYVKDAACIDETPSGHTTDIGNVSIECVSLKMNGEEITLKSDDTSAVDAKGILDYCLYNMWSADDTHFDLPEIEKLESIELTIKVTDNGSDDAAADEEAADDEDEAADDEAADDEDADADEDTDEDEDSDEDTDDADEDDADETFEVDWDSFDQAAMEKANKDFVFGVNDSIDLYSVLGDDIYDLATIDATFTWDAGTGWCGGGGLGNGMVLEDGSAWFQGTEFGCANANAGVVDDGKVTQTIMDITNNPIVEAASADADGSYFAVLMVQNWWNGVEANAKLEKLTFYNADGDVIGELSWASEEAPAAPAETQAPAAGDVAAATDSSKGSPDTGVADVAAVMGLAIVAGGAVLVAKKRK